MSITKDTFAITISVAIANAAVTFANAHSKLIVEEVSDNQTPYKGARIAFDDVTFVEDSPHNKCVNVYLNDDDVDEFLVDCFNLNTGSSDVRPLRADTINAAMTWLLDEAAV